MHSLLARLVHLERQRPPRAVFGYQITRVAPDGAVLRELVMVSGHRPGMATRYYSVDGFYETYPAGQVGKQLILTDDGREPDAGSLASEWFNVEVER
jgi:hypothetical protein